MSRPRACLLIRATRCRKKPQTHPSRFRPTIDFAAYRIANPEEFGRNMLRLHGGGRQGPVRLARAHQRQDRPAQHRQRGDRGHQAVHRDRPDLGRATRPSSPRRRATSCATTCSSPAPRPSACWAPRRRPWPSRSPATTASRTRSGSRNPYFDFWKQSYLITTRWLEDVLDKTEGLDERTRQRAEFYLKQLASALSPSNFPLTNPEVLRETLRHQRQEPRAGHGQPRPRHGEVGRRAQHQPDRRRGLRGRPQHRHRARQGRLPERAAAAHPVRADHREGARACRC